MISIEVVGAVKNPGVYHVPQGTTLTDIIALSGGPTAQAELDKVSIRPNKRSGRTSMEFDLEAFYTGEKDLNPPNLSHQDIVYIPEDQPFIDRDTATAIAALGTVVSTVLSIFLIRREIND